MKTNYASLVSMSVFFGALAYFICSFFVGWQLALLLAALAFAVCFIALLIYMKRYMKKVNAVDLSGVSNILFKDMANCYTNKLVGNGLLILTADALLFISTERKKALRLELPLGDIRSASYGNVYGHISGIKIVRTDSSEIGFVTQKQQAFLELLNVNQ